MKHDSGLHKNTIRKHRFKTFRENRDQTDQEIVKGGGRWEGRETKTKKKKNK